MKTYLLLLTVLTSFNTSFSQVSKSDSLQVQIPQLKIIISSAIENSSLLEIEEYSAIKINHEIAIIKKKWLDYIFIEGALNYGMYDQIVISDITNEISSQTALAARGQNLKYYGGIGVKIPFSELFMRKNRISIKEIEYKQSQSKITELNLEIKKAIIDEYYELIFLKESMDNFLEIFQTLEISKFKAEKDILDGNMDLSDYALLISIVGKAKNDYEKSKNSFLAQYFILQEISGLKF